MRLLSSKKVNFGAVLAMTMLCTLSMGTESLLSVPMSASLSFTPRTQEQSNWCWAASSVAVLGYFKTSATQTGFVTYVKGSPENKTGTWTETQTGLAHWNRTFTWASSLSYSTLTAEIATYQRPVMIGWNWFAGGGHMVVATGYSDDGSEQYVEYMDPATGTFKRNTYSWVLGGNSGSDHTVNGSLYQIK